MISKAEYGRATEPWVVDFLVACVNLIGAKRCLEIGVLRGQTTKAILDVLPEDACYVAVDPNPQELFWAIEDERLVLLKESSATALETLYEPFDFIFVDGDHSFAGAQRDIDQSVRLLRPGGILVIHDTLSTKEPCVGLAVRLHLPEAIHLDSKSFEWEGRTGLAMYSKPHYVMNINLTETYA